LQNIADFRMFFVIRRVAYIKDFIKQQILDAQKQSDYCISGIQTAPW
jgi:hypothetical protein